MESVEVVVIGAGLSGLATARDLSDAGREVLVLDAADAVGGRIRTDRVDGMLLDRGFQLLNPAYPALDGVVDVPALGLQQFDPGLVVANLEGRTVYADPFRVPSATMETARALMPLAVHELLSVLRLGTYVGRVALESPTRLAERDDVAYGKAFANAGIDGGVTRGILDVFLAGVLGESEQESSRRFVDLLLRTFARGVPGLPQHGMQALPQQLADRLPPGAIRLETSALAVDGNRVTTADSQIEAGAVVVATGGPQAADLVEIPAPPMRALTTFYHHAASSPGHASMLHIDHERRGPVVNTVPVSDAAPSYCAEGALIESTVLGAHDDVETERQVREHVATIYGVDPSAWEHVATYSIDGALPAMLPPLDMRQPQRVRDRVYVAGDHMDTASIQGAIVSGRRAARAVLAGLNDMSRR